MIEDYYGALGVPRDATKEAIEAAFRAREKEWTAALDAGDPRAPAQLKLVKAAHAFLIDDDKRELYDEIDKPVELPPRPVLVPGEDPPPEPEPFPVAEPPAEESPERAARRTRLWMGRLFGVLAIVVGTLLIIRGRSFDPSRDYYGGYRYRYDSSYALLDHLLPGLTRNQLQGPWAVVDGLFLVLSGLGMLIVPFMFGDDRS